MESDTNPIDSPEGRANWGDIEDRGLELAKEAAEGAYAPYSDFPVGAAVYTEEGYYTGANVEVGGRIGSVHAEMLAIQKAVMDGAVVDGGGFVVVCCWTPSDDIDIPCSMCQHVISEFADSAVIVAGTPEDKKSVTLKGEMGESWRPGENR